MNNYKLGSLFDGSGGFPLAGALCGIEPRWAAEVEPYPIAVTRSRFPNMTHLGDISKVSGAEIEPVDIITFGSPCQDLSVAGKRAGLKHESNGDEETTRSGLFMEAVRIIKEMRTATNGNYPRFALWENVPGAFSSNNGEDFRIVCEELIKIVEPSASMPAVPKGGWAYADSYVGDGWSLAYRVFDTQYWPGTPQRRRRIYLVADFRGERAREVLFEREGLRGYFTEGRTPWQAAPADAQGSPGADDREGEGFDEYNGDLTGDKSATLGVNCGGSTGRNGVIERGRRLDGVSVVPYTLKIRSGCEGGGKGALIQEDKSATLATNNDQYLFQPVARVFENHGQDSRYKGPVETAQTVSATYGMGGNNQPFVVEPFVKSARARSADDATTWKEGKVANTLNTFDQGEARANELVVEGRPVYCLQGNGIDRADTAGCNGKGVKEDVCYTLNTIDRPAVVYAVDQGGGKSGANVSENTAPTLCTTHGGEPAVAYGLDRASFNQGKNAQFDFSVTEEQQPTLTARGPGAVCHKATLASGKATSGCLMASGYEKLGAQEMFSGDYTVIEEIPAFCCTTGSFTQATEEVAPTLMARDWKDPTCVAYAESGTNGSRVSNTLVASMGNAPTGTTQDNLFVRTNYIVRRLTPTECARLQGFADQWGHIEQKDTLTEEELRFWLEVRNTHARINGKKEQDYTAKQMLTWYNKLWTDSAEYKMWGNGIALPTALYCVQGVADALERTRAEEYEYYKYQLTMSAVMNEPDDDWMN